MKSKLDIRLENYNHLLEFCRDIPRRKHEMEIEFKGIADSRRISSMITTLTLRGMLTRQESATHSKVFLYQSVPGAVYFHLPKVYKRGNREPRLEKAEKIIIEGNKTIVSCGVYHTHGNRHKPSAWIGSTAGSLA